MKLLEITNSSAISKISFCDDENIVGVCYTSSDRMYEFYCEDISEIQAQITEAHEKGESLGKLIHSLKKEGKLEVIPQVEVNDESH